MNEKYQNKRFVHRKHGKYAKPSLPDNTICNSCGAINFHKDNFDAWMFDPDLPMTIKPEICNRCDCKLGSEG